MHCVSGVDHGESYFNWDRFTRLLSKEIWRVELPKLLVLIDKIYGSPRCSAVVFRPVKVVPIPLVRLPDFHACYAHTFSPR